ncbi:hypothetical protein M8Z33_00030 [Streptomyces sp. ZAF1911]|uniref:hypothetical protein n=1 Tax=Streptomyces sp. ZAF1911 TaxID=2944129 RepID=UPI00237C0CC9|nr:hypothetical protein [Streptomyces sp. ZAF1911]MDD9375089.1 hypothetical protein [Streptomyces sp. ZAF1911]
MLTPPTDVEPIPGTVSAGAAHAQETLHWLAGRWPYGGATAVLLAGTRAFQYGRPVRRRTGRRLRRPPSRPPPPPTRRRTGPGHRARCGPRLARRQALRVSRDGVEQRIAALEEYAAQVCEADLRYQELQQIQRLVEGNDEALDLLARTAADALAVAEIQAMSTEAAIVAKTFSTALDRASAAAVIALPTRASA